MAEEQGNNRTPKLPLFSAAAAMKLKYSPQHSSGVLTPPVHSTLASVPFKWEEQPGKPRPCTDLIMITTTTTTTIPNSIFNDKPKCLEPPPRLYLENTKIPSPTTVLDRPCNNKCTILERGQLGTLVLYKNKVRRRGYWWQRFVQRRKGTAGNRKETGVGGGNFVFPSSSVDSTDCGSGSGSDEGGHNSRMKVAKSHSHIWASIHEGFKQVITWKKKKSKKEVLIL